VGDISCRSVGGVPRQRGPQAGDTRGRQKSSPGGSGAGSIQKAPNEGTHIANDIAFTCPSPARCLRGWGVPEHRFAYVVAVVGSADVMSAEELERLLALLVTRRRCVAP
jgi:hypothetical protein